MTFPVWFDIGGLKLHPHAAMEVIAYSGGFQIYLWLRRRRGERETVGFEKNMWVIVGAVVGALVGSKVLAWAESWPEYVVAGGWVVWLGGKTIVGGLLGGWMGVEVAKRMVGVRESTGDLFVFPLIFGMAVGRVGCFLTGLADHTYGVATGLAWGVDFGDGVRRHPTQVYEILFLTGWAIVLAFANISERRRGTLFRVFMLGYLAMRFAIEFIKPTYKPYGGLSAIQVACAMGMGVCVVWMARSGGDAERSPDVPEMSVGRE